MWGMSGLTKLGIALLLGAFFWIGWGVRGVIADDYEKALNQRNNDLESQLKNQTPDSPENQMPELIILNETWGANPDGTYTALVDVEFVAKLTPSLVVVTVQGMGLIDVEFQPFAVNLTLESWGEKEQTRDTITVEIENPRGKYQFSVKAEKKVPLSWDAKF